MKEKAGKAGITVKGFYDVLMPGNYITRKEHLLDMQPFYGIDTVTTMINNIGTDGVRHYLYYFGVDFVFIIVLLWVQIEITKSVSGHRNTMYKIMVTCVVARGGLDFSLLVSLFLWCQ